MVNRRLRGRVASDPPFGKPAKSGRGGHRLNSSPDCGRIARDPTTLTRSETKVQSNHAQRDVIAAGLKPKKSTAQICLSGRPGHRARVVGLRENCAADAEIGPWRDQLNGLLLSNEGKPSRERLTLIRNFEELRGLGYEGSYDAVRRYAKAWAKERGTAAAQAYVPLSFSPGEPISSIGATRSS
jgi:hypothetical protein